jgi:hypothetical protein|tara:strand:+ start:1311 stop:4454 length:3144 start_codon:yes stop_codon:yes gene_type:complete
MVYIPGQLSRQKQATGVYIPGQLSRKRTRKTVDVSDITKLKAYAETRGLEVKKKKPSLFRRVIDIISRPLYTSAGAVKAVVEGENVAKEAWKGLTGKDKETFSDVLEVSGVKNKYVKGGLGFVLDVALDPLTYFGGGLIKGGLKIAGKGLRPAGRMVAKMSPERANYLMSAGDNLKKAFGGAFVFGYGTSKGLADDVHRALNKIGIAKEDIIEGNIQAIGKKYAKKEIEEAGELMITNRRLELGARKTGITPTYKLSKSAKVNTLVDTFRQKAKVLAKKSGIDEERAYQYYFPFLRKDKLIKRPSGEAGILKTGGQGYLKQFGNLIKDENLLRKPIEAYSRREFEIVRDAMSKGTVDDLVKAYGKPANSFKNVDMASVAGYKPIYKKGPLQFFKVKTQPAEDILRQVSAQSEPFERAMIKVGKGIQDAVKEGVPVSATKSLRKAAGVYVPSTNEIKLKYFTPDVLLHERGHSWDFMNSRLSKAINTNRTFQKELRILTERFYGGTAQQRGSAVEKWAVFIDNFIHNPSFVKKNAPMFTSYFRKKIKTDWAFKKAYQAAAKQIKIIDKTVKNIKPALQKADKGFLETAIRTAFPGKEFVGVSKARPIGYLKETDAKFINDFLFPEFKAIDKLAKASGYDGFTRYFKTLVTAYFPAFHVRNYISGNIQNYQVLGTQAFNPKNHNVALSILKGTNKSVKLGKQTYNTKTLNKVMQEEFKGASRFISDIGEYIEELTGSRFRVKKIGKARQFGNFVEMNQKAVAMTGALRQGKTLKEAVKLAEQAGFDYSKITKFESKIMRRAIPFYTFARKNAELQARTFVKRPERILNQVKMANALSVAFGGKTTPEDLEGLPPWVLSGLGFKIEGNKYLSKFGLPLEEFLERMNKPLGTSLSSLNPIVKYPLEAKLGYDFFRERAIVDINKVAPATGELLMKAKEAGKLPKFIDEALNIKSYVSKHDGKTKYTMSPSALHKLRNIPTSRFQNTFEKLFDKDMDKVNKWLSFFSGGKIYDIDQEQQKFFTEKDLRDDIENQLMQRGIGKEFKNFYIYKD